ncbi:Arc family DNA-binding protein [Thauera aromatica]|uniref:Arc-like DNA binding domain-containing protein n=1 Tax=Thauera aromatica K172 TaxID=44139 RepID=A0A2R4BNV5_THAAR|nr:Arc family DNA-binding protein [Thauera aromatica]AVR88999.1 hypothetical protein Tharo_2096 [Thauera aromatica K172]
MKKSQVASIICAMSDKLTPYPSRTADQFVVRFPDGMRDRLKEAAHANGRSMNAEIVARLQASFEQPAPANIRLIDRISDSPSIVDEIAAKLAQMTPEQLARPLADILEDLRHTQEALAESAAAADRALTLVRHELPPGTPVSSDPLALVRRMAAILETGQDKPRPPVRPPPKRTTLRKHTKRHL